MLIMTSEGLYCPLSDFHIDPKRKSEWCGHNQVHSNHARKKTATYYCSDPIEIAAL